MIKFKNSSLILTFMYKACLDSITFTSDALFSISNILSEKAYIPPDPESELVSAKYLRDLGSLIFL